MKMRAGLKLKKRKPTTAPSITAMTTASRMFPPMYATTKFVSPAKKTIPAASPSSPSIKLIAFTTPTIQRTVTGRPKTPIDIERSNETEIASIRKPHVYASVAAAIWA